MTSSISLPGSTTGFPSLNSFFRDVLFDFAASLRCLRSLGYCSEQRNSAYLSIIIVHICPPISSNLAMPRFFGTFWYPQLLLEHTGTMAKLPQLGKICKTTRKHYSASAIDSCTSQGSQECLSKISKLHVTKLYNYIFLEYEGAH